MRKAPRSMSDLKQRTQKYITSRVAQHRFRATPLMKASVERFLRAKTASELDDNNFEGGPVFHGLWGGSEGGYRFTSVKLVPQRRMAFLQNVEPDQLMAGGFGVHAASPHRQTFEEEEEEEEGDVTSEASFGAGVGGTQGVEKNKGKAE